MEKDPVTKYLENEKFKIQVEKAKKRFGFKSFAERFKQFKYAAEFVRRIFPIFSVALGMFWLQRLLLGIAEGSFLISGIIAVVLMMIAEIVKAFSITEGTVLLYIQDWLKGIALAIVAFVFIGLSMFAAVEGAKEYHAKTDKRVEGVELTNKLLADSIGQSHNERIAAAKSLAEEFRKANTIRDASGHNVVKYGKPTSQYTELIKNVAALEEDKRQALKEFEERAKTERATAVGESGQATSYIIYVSIFIESLIFLSNWFLVHYDFETAYLEYLLTKEEEDKKGFLEFAKIYHLHKVWATPMEPDRIMPAQPKPQIGFHTSKNGKGQDALDSSLDPRLRPSHSQELKGQKGQEISRNFQENAVHGQELGQAFGASDGASLSPIERAIQSGLLQELRKMKAHGKKMAYQDITQRYGLSIPQIISIRKMFDI